MRVWNFGASQSMGHDHDSEYIRKPRSAPQKIRVTAYPWLIARKFEAELTNFAHAGYNYEKIYQDIVFNYKNINPDDIVLVQINTCFTTPYYFTPDGKYYHLYSPRTVLEDVPDEFQDRAAEFYMEHRNLYGDWFKFMNQTIMIMELLDSHGVKPVYLTCDGNYPNEFHGNRDEGTYFNNAFENYRLRLHHYKVIDMKTFALSNGFKQNSRHYDIMTHRKLANLIANHEHLLGKAGDTN